MKIVPLLIFFLSYLYLTVVLKDTVSTNFSLYVLKAYSAI